MKRANHQMCVLTGLAALCAVTAFGAAARPAPRPALLKRLTQGPDVIGIVHWGLNTYTDKEWGSGDEDPARLAPDAFDADQIVGACKAGGLGGLVVVAKHHDGFCLWPTKTTGHNITKSPFRGGKGDYVREMERACRKAGLKFGVYVSPWDRNNADYGTPKYVETYHAQIKELLGGDYGEIFEMWFDNANGGDGYYGGARETRKIPSDYYRFDEVFRFVRELQPGVCIFNEDDGADFRWPGNEKGILDPECRATGRHFDIARYKDYMAWTDKGVCDGTTFHPAEADFPLRKGWFYHAKERGRTKNAAYLMQRYLETVGHGGTMNIGIAPDKSGRLDEEDVRALAGFGVLRKAFFAKVEDGKGLCNVVDLREDISHGELVDAWELKADGKVIASGTSVGIRRIRILDTPVKRSSIGSPVCRYGAEPHDGYRVDMLFHYVEPELLKLVQGATTESGETDTAKWMNATR